MAAGSRSRFREGQSGRLMLRSITSTGLVSKPSCRDCPATCCESSWEDVGHPGEGEQDRAHHQVDCEPAYRRA